MKWSLMFLTFFCFRLLKFLFITTFLFTGSNQKIFYLHWKRQFSNVLWFFATFRTSKSTHFFFFFFKGNRHSRKPCYIILNFFGLKTNLITNFPVFKDLFKESEEKKSSVCLTKLAMFLTCSKLWPSILYWYKLSRFRKRFF